MGAVRWAYEEADADGADSGLSQIPLTLGEALGNTLKTVANIRKTGCLTLAGQVRENFLDFANSIVMGENRVICGFLPIFCVETEDYSCSASHTWLK